MKVPARRFGLCERFDIEENVVDQMLYAYRTANPGVMTKNEAGHWVFESANESHVRAFLRDEKNVQQAREKNAVFAAHSAGRRKAFNETVIRVQSKAGLITLSIPEAEVAFRDMVSEIEMLQEKLNRKQKIYEVVDAFGVKHVMTPEIMLTALNAARDRNILLHDQVMKLKAQQTVAKSFTPPPPAANNPNPVVRTTDMAADEIAAMIAGNPELFFPVSSQSELSERIIREARKRGLKTAFGLDWTKKNMNNYKNKIRSRVQDLMRNNKPRIRVSAATRVAA